MLLVSVSTIVIYNIFNIIFQDMTSQIGIMKSIGMSNKKVRNMLIIMSFIYIILGTLVGIVFGMIFFICWFKSSVWIQLYANNTNI